MFNQNLDSQSTQSSLDTDDEVVRRKSIFFKFAKQNIANQMRRKIDLKGLKKVINEESWTPASESKREADRFSYTHPYRAVYNVEEKRDQESQDEPDESKADEAIIDDDASSIMTSPSSVPNLPSIKPRKGGSVTSPPSVVSESVVNFEAISTIQAPTVVHAQEYTSTVESDELREEFFNNYATNRKLPIYPHRSYVLNSINTYNVVIIEGATGCGKTTQVPMYILEDALLNKRIPKSPVIYVTQPRRIAAKSIANRVCAEHNWEVGSIVGYQVGLDKCVGPKSVLIYCTAGVLLQKLIQEKSLKNFTHIIIDEAHERDADTDLLLMIIRTLMRTEMSFFRLIVMSATMDVEKLKNYYTFRTDYGHKALTTPSICRIGRHSEDTNQNVQCIFFDRLRSTFKVKSPVPNLDYDEPEVHMDCLKGAVEIVLEVIPHLDTYSESTKSTLVFLPGLADIIKFHSMLNEHGPSSSNLDIIPLHSCISSKDQFKVFETSPHGRRKVILATNIAESSITVSDVGFIIDFCLTKVLKKDPITKFPILTLEWSSVDKCIQRAGRTGRCCKGKVFRMVSYTFFNQFKLYADPELLVAPLELSVLRIKSFDMGEVKALLAIVLDPPPIDDIRSAVLELKQIGALSSTYEGKLSDMDGDLTELGKVIATLPIDVRLSKLIVIANVLDILEEAIIVAASLSTNHSVVRNDYKNPLKTYVYNLEWANGSFSDLFVSLDVYREFVFHRDDEQKNSRWLDQFCEDHQLEIKKLNEISALAQEIVERLKSVNIILLDQPNRERNKQEDELMLKIAICAAFYPQYFVAQKLDGNDIERAFSGLDPTKTVICEGFPPQSSALYRSHIFKQLEELKIAKDMDIIVDNSRILVTFLDPRELRERATDQLHGLDEVIRKTQGVSQSVLEAVKLPEFKKIGYREYKPEIAHDRMKYYRDKMTRIRQATDVDGKLRLMPSRMKLVVGRAADNSSLLTVRSEDYSELVAMRDYVEVEFNSAQDLKDLNDLYKIEIEEERRSDAARSRGIDPDPVEHPIFLPFKDAGGPYSPIQMKFRSVLDRSKNFGVDVDRSSVNSVLLDPDYKQNRRQLLVASTVQHNKRGKVHIKDTTLMPSIHGLATLMSLLFAQYYRLVYNNKLHCVCGAIFGIGWHKNDEPVDIDYQVELAFDIHVTKSDIQLINKAREDISALIRFIDVHNPGAPRNAIQQELRQILLALIKKRRFSINEISINTIDWSTEEFSKDGHNIPKEQSCAPEKGRQRAFLPVMEFEKMSDEWDLYVAIRNNLDILGLIETYQMRIPLEGVGCLLCGSGQEHIFLIQSKIIQHVNSQSHLERLHEFEIFEERARQRREAAIQQNIQVP